MEPEKTHLDTVENASQQSSDLAGRHGAAEHNKPNLPYEAGENDIVTMKTWIVVTVLSLSYGLSFWSVPAIGAIGTQIATELGNPSDAAWWTTTYTMTTAISFMLFGGNSDLFGRRWFIIAGNVLVFIGLILIGSAKNTQSITAGNASIGVGADASTWIAVLFGPITARYAIIHEGRWRWLFYSPAIITGISFVLLVILYHPPKHPRGIPWGQALKQLDYLGMLLFTVGATLVFTGVIYTTILPSSNTKVVATLSAGFGTIVLFALWETFGKVKQPLTPPWVFAQDKGREFFFPFIAGTIVNMFFYSVNIAYPTAINVLWTDPTTPLSYSIELTLPQNLGLIFGSMMLMIFGIKIGHWKWQFVGSFAVMTIFGALLALATPNNRAMIMVFVFICEGAYGWAQTLSIAWIQFGVPQTELGISGALAGVARWTGGAIASSMYLTILANTQGKKAAQLVPAAAMKAGASSSTAQALLKALPLGATAIAKVANTTPAMVQAAGAAFVQSYVVGLRTICLVSIAFGVIGTICCALSNDIGPKMNRKIEVFLENDVQAEKNKFH
ncbi:MFS general substrate transporter [Microthyrium microscopicum]|uniref:MFS general substrate transporter n=1 Tax=Microthyrium microscopicum TaxID=703497 RepID=A0A6A6UID6_9PEZI|nr:MFS general substrate transporter [Microthyrium microscopicum]